MEKFIDEEDKRYFLLDLAGAEGYLLSQIHAQENASYGDGHADLFGYIRAVRKAIAILNTKPREGAAKSEE